MLNKQAWAEEVMKQREKVNMVRNCWKLSDITDPWKRNRDLRRARKLARKWVNRHRDADPGKYVPVARRAWGKWVSDRIKCGAFWLTYEAFIGGVASSSLCILAQDIARKLVLVCRRRRNHAKDTVGRL